MKYLDEYRDAEKVKRLSEQIAMASTRPWTIMEVCGGQTHSILKYGIDQMLPKSLTLVHGPGCPVCVTPLEQIDRAVAIARTPGVVFCSFGDMLRVPGSTESLQSARSRGADVRIVYSPLDAVKLSRDLPDRQVVFFAVGFETTAPANAMAVELARQNHLINFSVLVSHVLVRPAMERILSSPSCRVQGFLAAGHVCTITGYEEYKELSARYQLPIIVTGFEPVDILQGVLFCVSLLEEGRVAVENQYSRSVKRQGNSEALALMEKVFQVVPRKWRGLGEISESGLALRGAYARYDAERRFSVEAIHAEEPKACISGMILQGLKKPPECTEFGSTCSPSRPLGAPMVSSEGACAAYYRYRTQERIST